MIILSADDRRTCLVKRFASLFSVAARETSRAYVLLKCQNHRAGTLSVFNTPYYKDLRCSFSGLENGLLRWHMNMHYRLSLLTCKVFHVLSGRTFLHVLHFHFFIGLSCIHCRQAPKTSCMDAFRMSELYLESTEGLLIRPTQTDHQDQSNTHCSKITKFLVGRFCSPSSSRVRYSAN